MSKKELAINRLAGHLEAIITGFKYLLAEPRMTVRYPEEVIELPDGYRGMIVYHRELCISCSLCAMICPADAIKMYLEQVPRAEGRGFCQDAKAKEVSRHQLHSLHILRLLH